MALQLNSAQTQRHNFDFSHDVITSSNFGLYQPTLCREIVPNSKINVSNLTFVRLANMVCPTFGRMQCITHYTFVPMTTVFPHFVEFLNQQQVSTGSGSLFTYTKLPSFTMQQVLFALLSGTYISKITGTKPFASSVKYAFYNFSSGRINTGSDISEIVFNQNGKQETSPQSFSMYEAQEDITTDYFIFKRTTPDTYTFSVGNCNLTITFTDSISPDAQVLRVQLLGQSKRLLSILRGLGYNGVSFYAEKEYSLLPVLSYIRAYYDLFLPKRENNFENTVAHRLKTLYQYQDGDLINSDTLQQLINELLQYYTYKPDYFTSALNTINGGVTLGTSVLNGSNPNDVYDILPNGQGSTQTTDGVTAIQIKGLLQMSKYINRTTHVGKQALEWLKSKFGVISPTEQYNKSYYIGTTHCNVEISDLYATANSQGSFGTSLGDYTGRGIGADRSENFTFESREFGYLIGFTTIVPISGYFEGIKPHVKRLKPLQFYTPEYDGLGYQAIPQNEVVGGTSEKVFGFVPRYSDYKYEQNLVNGDFYGSTELSAYHLNRMFNPESVRSGHTNITNDDINIVLDNGFRTMADDETQGQQSMLRIFANTQKDVDHFLIFMRQNLHIQQPMKTISQSIDVERGVDKFDVQYT